MSEGVGDRLMGLLMVALVCSTFWFVVGVVIGRGLR